jgi:Holliday junction resolvase RusA-like endonuclease
MSDTTLLLEFFVPGHPAPGGSKRGFFIKKLNRVAITDAGGARTKNWRASVVQAAAAAMEAKGLSTIVEGPLATEIIFYMPRPKSHFRTGKNAGQLRIDAPLFHTPKPDYIKLTRSTEDALTDAGVWRDDSLVSRGWAEKRYGPRPGAMIRVLRIETQ